MTVQLLFSIQNSPQRVTQMPPRRAPDLDFAYPCSTLATFPINAFLALPVLLDCFVAALEALLGTCWASLGGSWAPLVPHSGPLGRQVGLPSRPRIPQDLLRTLQDIPKAPPKPSRPPRDAPKYPSSPPWNIPKTLPRLPIIQNIPILVHLNTLSL